MLRKRFNLGFCCVCYDCCGLFQTEVKCCSMNEFIIGSVVRDMICGGNTDGVTFFL